MVIDEVASTSDEKVEATEEGGVTEEASTGSPEIIAEESPSNDIAPTEATQADAVVGAKRGASDDDETAADVVVDEDAMDESPLKKLKEDDQEGATEASEATAAAENIEAALE